MSIEERLQRSFADLDDAVGGLAVDPFEQPADRRTHGVIAVAVVLLGLIGGLSYVFRDGDVEPIVTVDVADQLSTTLVEPEPTWNTVGIEPDEPGGIRTPINTGAGAWNADGSAMLLYRGDDGHLVVWADGSTSTELDVPAPDIEQVFWDPLDPAVIWYPVAETNTIAKLDALTGATVGETITVGGCETLTAYSEAGPNPMALDDGRLLFGLSCETQNETRLVLVDLQSGGVVASQFSPSVGSIKLSKSGRFGVTHVDSRLSVFDGAFEAEMFSVDIEPEFALVDLDGIGEVVVGRRFSGEGSAAALLIVDLATGVEETVIGPDRGHSFPPGGLRMAVSPNGVVALRVPAEAVTDQDDPLQAGRIHVVDLADPTRTVRTAAESVNTIGAGDMDVWFRGHLSMNRAGTAVAFSTNAEPWPADRVSTAVSPESSWR